MQELSLLIWFIIVCALISCSVDSSRCRCNTVKQNFDRFPFFWYTVWETLTLLLFFARHDILSYDAFRCGAGAGSHNQSRLDANTDSNTCEELM